MPNALQELARRKIGRFSVLKRAENDKHGLKRYVCRCSCGTVKVVNGSSLRSGRSRSCGCLKVEIDKKRNTTHGQTRTPTYSIWQTIIARCYDRKRPSYNNYGARGITVCTRWRKSFIAFIQDMGERPKVQSQLRRRNYKLGYCKSNCYWGRRTSEMSNSSLITKFIDYQGVRMSVVDCSRRCGIKYKTL
jgi:hypothetical protein